MSNSEMEMLYTQMQNSIKAELLTLNQAKKLVMQCAGLRAGDELGKAVAAINAEIGALEYLLETNRIAHERTPHHE